MERSRSTTLIKLTWLIILIGVGVASYLVYSRYSGSTLECGLSSCGVVNNSEYSVFLGIPVAVWGLLFYIGMGAVLYLKQYKLFLLGSITGVLFSAYLTYLEAFVIEAWCQWCILSAWLAVAIFVIALRLHKLDSELNPGQNQKPKE